MSLSREPNMREWLESLRARNDEQIKAGNSPPFTTMPSYSQLTTWLIDVQNENEQLREELTRKTSKTAGDYAITANLEVQSLNKRITDQIEELREKARTIDALREDENQEARRMEALIAELKIIIEGQNETLAKHAQETEYRNKITAELIEQRDNLKEQIVEKDKIILNLNEQLAVRKNQIRIREEWFNELETENKKLKADHARQNRITDQKQRDYGNLHTRYEALVTEIKELMGRNNNNQADTIKEMRKKYEELQAVEKNQQDTQEYHKTVLENVKAAMAKRDAEVANLRKIVETKDAALNTLREQRSYQQKEIAKLNAEVQNRVNRILTIEKHKAERDKLAGRIGALQHSNNELGRKYQITMNRYNKLLERVKKMEMSTKLKVPGLEDASGEMKPMVVSQVWDGKNPADIGLLKNCTFSPPTEPSSEPKRGEFVTSPPTPLTYAQLTEWIEQLRKTIDMLQFNLEHQTNVRKAKEKELAELRRTVYELQKATNGIEYEYMEPARSGRDFVTYFAFEARSQKDTPTGRRRISF